jgi:predicted nucleotidyltransferase
MNPSAPTYEELRSLVLKTYGPPQVISSRLRDVNGVEEAYLFGSWAARAAGSSAGFNDIDVLVVGRPDRFELDVASLELTELLGHQVQMTVVSTERWREPDTGFLKTVKARPHVRIWPEDADG